jgi:hypothetical protein
MATAIEGVCEKCGRGVHIGDEGDLAEPGRTICDGCRKPTSNCTCT